MSSSYRFTIRLGPKDAELAAALKSYPPGQRSIIIRTALRAWLYGGQETLERLMEAMSLQKASAGPSSPISAEASNPDLVADFLNDFLGSS